jgi:thymidine phosphorylase
VASIMSKKLAESLDDLVLDVKYGSGAFMKTRETALSLGEAMQVVGEAMGVRTRVLYHPMDEPLGASVGNALEVAESLACLRGGGPTDLRKIVLDLAVEVATADRSCLENWLDDGTALAKFREMVRWQGGDPDCLDDYDQVHRAPVIEEITSLRSGTLAGLSADAVARAGLALGAGRGKADDSIDPAVGFDRIVKVGAKVAVGDVLGRVHARTAQDAAVARTTFLGGCEYAS